MFGEGLLDSLQRDVLRRRHAAERGEALCGDLVEGEVRRCRTRAGEGHAARLAHHLQFAVLGTPAMQAEHQHPILGPGLVERLLQRDA